jgi:hypothetical protein
MGNVFRQFLEFTLMTPEQLESHLKDEQECLEEVKQLRETGDISLKEIEYSHLKIAVLRWLLMPDD